METSAHAEYHAAFAEYAAACDLYAECLEHARALGEPSDRTPATRAAWDDVRAAMTMRVDAGRALGLA